MDTLRHSCNASTVLRNSTDGSVNGERLESGTTRFFGSFSSSRL